MFKQTSTEYYVHKPSIIYSPVTYNDIVSVHISLIVIGYGERLIDYGTFAKKIGRELLLPSTRPVKYQHQSNEKTW